VQVEHTNEDVPAEFINALKDDLNTPAAFAELHKLAKQANAEQSVDKRKIIKKQLLASGYMLGILQQDPAEWFKGVGDVNESEIKDLLNSRLQAKKDKNFQLADEIRDKLTSMDIQVLDHPDGTSSWRKL